MCSGRAGDSPVTHRFCRSREDRQEHVQVVLASNWCLRVGRVRFGSAGVAHHGFPVVCVEAFFPKLKSKARLYILLLTS